MLHLIAADVPGLNSVLQLDVVTVTFILGTVIPLLTGLITKAKTSPGVKAAVNLVLSIAAGVGAAIVQVKGSITVGQIITAISTTYIASGSTYSHLWKPSGAVDKVAAIAPDTGIGKPVIEVPAKEDPPVDPVLVAPGPGRPPDVAAEDEAREAARRSGWNEADGKPPYEHALPPPDALVDPALARANPIALPAPPARLALRQPITPTPAKPKRKRPAKKRGVR